MGKKCLIIYASRTGNTAKVAERIKATFERNAWECNSFKIDDKMDMENPPFDFKDYDFVCAGTGVASHTAYNEIINLIKNQIIINLNSKKQQYFSQHPELSGIVEGKKSTHSIPSFHDKIVLGPNSRKGITFATYAGYDFGPKEAEPAMGLLALYLEHLEFKDIGHFCCPGKYLDLPTPETYYGDIRDRPNERDLLKAAMFIEDKLEEIAERSY